MKIPDHPGRCRVPRWHRDHPSPRPAAHCAASRPCQRTRRDGARRDAGGCRAGGHRVRPGEHAPAGDRAQRRRPHHGHRRRQPAAPLRSPRQYAGGPAAPAARGRAPRTGCAPSCCSAAGTTASGTSTPAPRTGCSPLPADPPGRRPARARRTHAGLGRGQPRPGAAAPRGRPGLVRPGRGAAAAGCPPSAPSPSTSPRAPRCGPTAQAGYRLRELGRVVDVVQLMAYDQHGPAGRARARSARLAWQRARAADRAPRRTGRTARPRRRGLRLHLAAHRHRAQPHRRRRPTAGASRRRRRPLATGRRRVDAPGSPTAPGCGGRTAAPTPRGVRLAAEHDLHGLAVWRLGSADTAHPARKLNRTCRSGLSTLRSTRQMLCQVPSASRPSSTGTVAYGGDQRRHHVGRGRARGCRGGAASGRRRAAGRPAPRAGRRRCRRRSPGSRSRRWRAARRRAAARPRARPRTSAQSAVRSSTRRGRRSETCGSPSACPDARDCRHGDPLGAWRTDLALLIARAAPRRAPRHRRGRAHSEQSRPSGGATSARCARRRPAPSSAALGRDLRRGLPGRGHRAFGVDDPGGRQPRADAARAVRATRSSRRCDGEPQQVDEPGTGNATAARRRLEGDADRAARVEPPSACSDPQEGRASRSSPYDGLRPSGGSPRTATATWFGGLRRASRRSRLGIFSTGDGLARFQSVETHPEHRRRGRPAAGRPRRRARPRHARRATPAVIVADPDARPIRIRTADVGSAERGPATRPSRPAGQRPRPGRGWRSAGGSVGAQADPGHGVAGPAGRRTAKHGAGRRLTVDVRRRSRRSPRSRGTPGRTPCASRCRASATAPCPSRCSCRPTPRPQPMNRSAELASRSASEETAVHSAWVSADRPCRRAAPRWMNRS